jgi:hypothetical protein
MVTVVTVGKTITNGLSAPSPVALVQSGFLFTGVAVVTRNVPNLRGTSRSQRFWGAGIDSEGYLFAGAIARFLKDLVENSSLPA